MPTRNWTPHRTRISPRLCDVYGALLRKGSETDDPNCRDRLQLRAPWNGVDDTMSDSVVVLKADLRQLRCELESELARLLDQLLTSLS